ncbi:MAG: NUDIX domain-containing protein [Simkaniaceae bacterium]|nr:NUDIX domain-containing protein [Simkaniaceae bacterium]
MGAPIFDISYGIIPLCHHKQGWSVFLVQHRNGSYWGFPKGHANDGETPIEAAKRELFEETHLQVSRFLDTNPIAENYEYRHVNGQIIDKHVHYYLGEVTSADFELQHHEIMSGEWLTIQKALEKITYNDCRAVCEELMKRIEK